MTNLDLVNMAIGTMKNSYSPYSNFKVGAALLCENNEVYLGTNIENSSFSATNCAERTAFFKAISEGNNKFSKIAVVGGKGGKITSFCSPCGVCRQVMTEFCDKDFIIYLATESGWQTFTLADLLPHCFSL